MRKSNLKVITGNEELLVMIGKLGGIDKGIAFRCGLSVPNMNWQFHNGAQAKTPDEMAELLREEGFSFDGENSLIEAIQGSLTGVTKHYTPIGAINQMELEDKSFYEEC